MKRFTFLCLLSFATALFAATLKMPAQAQTSVNETQDSTKTKKERTISLNGKVADSFTKADLKAFITIMTTDSAVVDTMTTWYWDRNSFFEVYVPAHPQKYIFKAECKGYETTYQNYEVKYLARNRSFDVPTIYMKRLFKEDDANMAEDEMEGVTVVGTRIKVVNRGDTLVFNAAAFNLPEGSMLDNLIRQMPGVELKDNGDIYVNGRKVDFLTLNGEDFFKGNNKMMLENLPYYTVKEVKVYNKETDRSRLMGITTEQKDYVMDVNLKREYNRSYLGNVEMAAGTRDRRMSRVFGLYFDDKTQFSIFANANNINENRRPGSEGEWKPTQMSEGVKTTQMIGFSLNTKNNEKSINEKLEGAIEWGKTEEEQHSASEQFASNVNDNTFTRVVSSANYDRLSIDLSNTFQLEKPISVYSIASLKYNKNSYDRAANSALFNRDVSQFGNTKQIIDSIFASRNNGMRDAIVNQQLNKSEAKVNQLNGNFNIWADKKLAWGDIVAVGIEADYNRITNENYALNNVTYSQLLQNDRRNTYSDQINKNYSYGAGLAYYFPLRNGLSLSPSVSYKQQQSSEGDQWYRLDKLGNQWSDPSNYSVGVLPSTRDSLLMALDAATSFNLNNIKRSIKEAATISYDKDNRGSYTQFQIQLPIKQTFERTYYHSEQCDTTLKRHYTHFNPSLNCYISRDNWQKTIFFNYSCITELPDLRENINYVDNRMPTAIRLRNSNMTAKTTHSYFLMAYLNNNSINQVIHLNLSGNITHGAFGNKTYYIPATGTYIYQPDNVNGNWNTDLELSVRRSIDKKKRWYLETGAWTTYTHSVDFGLSTISDLSAEDTSKDAVGYYYSLIENQNAILSKVNTITYGGKAKINYQKGDLTVGANSSINWRHSSSNNTDFANLAAREFDYGITLQYKFPLDIRIATDMKMFSRRGYQTAEMNTDDLIWNASLSRTFCKGKLTCSLEGFDLLHNLKVKTYTVNAQGHTETWKNTIPRYAMLHISYKFSKR